MPGHGDHWGALYEIDGLLDDVIVRDCEEGSVVCKTSCMDAKNGGERQEELVCLRRGGQRFANQILLVRDSAERNHYLFSGYPVALDGMVHRVTVREVAPWEYGVEGWLHVDGDLPFAFFDSMFFMGSDQLKPGDTVDYSIAAIAYSLRPIRMRTFQIQEGPFWEMEKQRRMDAGESPEEAARPVEFHMTGAAIFLPRDGEECDEAEIQGVIESTDSFDHDGQTVYRLEIIVARPDDGEFKLPIFVAEHVLEGYRPRLGDDVEGVVWLQGRRVGVEPDAQPKIEFEDICIQ